MSYSYVLCESCDDISRSDWEEVCGPSGNPFMDVGFLRAVENAVTEPGKYWYAILYDESRSPVGCACFSLFIVDGALLAPSLFRRLAGRLRKLLPWFFRFKLLLCGLPVSTSAGQVVALPDADWRQLAMSLDEIACGLARRERAALISFKEFDEELTANLSGLRDRGYRPAHSVTTFIFDADFQSFDEYYQSRSKRTRANMRKSFRKFEDGGLRCVCLKGGDGVPELFRTAVHRLYEAVYERAEVKFEYLPVEFFREFASQLADTSRFTFLYEGDAIVAFCCGLASENRYDMLYCGIDYDRNASADVYFNMMYRALEYGLSDGVRRAHIGASADEFKRRMGCRPMPLSIYVKAYGAIPSMIFRALFRWIFR